AVGARRGACHPLPAVARRRPRTSRHGAADLRPGRAARGRGRPLTVPGRPDAPAPPAVDAGTGAEDERAPAMLVLGESLIDIVEHAGRAPVEHVGGSPANVALGLARLGHPVELSTWFAADALGRRIRTWLEADG